MAAFGHRRLWTPPQGSEGERTDFDELLDGDVDDVPENLQGASFALPGRDFDAEAALRGRTFTLPLAYQTASDPFSVISIPAEKEERLWTITVQVLQQATGESAQGAYVTLLLEYGQGQARFRRPIQIPPSQVPVKFTLNARYINASFYYSTGAPTAPATISLGIVPGGYLGADAYAWTWVQKTGNTSFATVWTGPGVLGQIHEMVTAVTAVGTPIWLLGFDEIGAGAPAGGSQLVFGLRLGATFAQGDDRSYGDQFAPGSTFWVTGLKLAMSTSPDAYAAPAVGNYFSADVLVGQ
jgi:hypothetical protein